MHINNWDSHGHWHSWQSEPRSMSLSVPNYHLLTLGWAGVYSSVASALLEHTWLWIPCWKENKTFRKTWPSWNYCQKDVFETHPWRFSAFSPRFACSGSGVHSPFFLCVWDKVLTGQLRLSSCSTSLLRVCTSTQEQPLQNSKTYLLALESSDCLITTGCSMFLPISYPMRNEERDLHNQHS